MKAIIGLSILLAASAVIASATTTKKVKISDKSFKERVGIWYYGEIDRNAFTKAPELDNNNDFLNYLNISYEINSKAKFNLTLRNNLTDRNAENGEGDRYEEYDPRIGAEYVLMKNSKSKLKVKLVFEVPMSRYSFDDERITRLKPSITYTTQIDDNNKILLFAGFNKTYYKESAKPIDETSRHYVTSWISYTNSTFSEKYRFRVDIDGLMRHQEGQGDFGLKASSTEERIIAGVNFELAGLDLFPYLQHDPSGLQALNTLGAGVQIFKAF